MSNETENKKEESGKKSNKIKKASEESIYIEKSILKYFKERIGDKYKLELEEENEHKREIQENIQ